MPRAARAILPILFSPKRCPRNRACENAHGPGTPCRGFARTGRYLARGTADAHVYDVLGLTSHLGRAIRFLRHGCRSG